MQRMEKEIAETEDALVQLRAKEEALEENIRKVKLGHLHNQQFYCIISPIQLIIVSFVLASPLIVRLGLIRYSVESG